MSAGRWRRRRGEAGGGGEGELSARTTRPDGERTMSSHLHLVRILRARHRPIAASVPPLATQIHAARLQGARLRAVAAKITAINRRRVEYPLARAKTRRALVRAEMMLLDIRYCCQLK